jgi:Rieske Fe-S protein
LKRMTRREFVVLGAALGAVPLAASCGGEEPESGEAAPEPTTPEETTVDETTAEETVAEEAPDTLEEREEAPAIAAESELRPNSSRPFEASGGPAVLVRLASGEFVAYSAVCTHRGCTVAYRLDTQQLACPCHGSVFDPAGGAAVVAGPAQAPLPEVGIEIRYGGVYAGPAGA